jgi:hypothetical protein
MNSILGRLFIALSFFVLMGCSESLEIQLAPQVSVYFSKDSDKNVNLTEKNAEYKQLQQWLNTHKEGWYSTSGRYPGGVYVKSGEHGIQVTENHVVIYSTTSAKPKAIYIQEITKKELREVRLLGQ